jgi:hypothetical protein
MPKNIVICCDGNYEGAPAGSNVLKLYQTLAQDLDTQVAYFHPGVDDTKKTEVPGALSEAADLASVATGFIAPKLILDILKPITHPISKFFQGRWNRLVALLFGSDLATSVEDAYAYLMEAYEHDDAIFIFGFGRGAYTARALAAALHVYGLLWPGNEPMRKRLFRMWRKGTAAPHAFAIAASFNATFGRRCNLRFLGVWDTVASFGWLYNPIKIPYTATNPDVKVVRHAVSIDERRAFFRHNLWGNPGPGQDVKQVWFAGVHADIGGGYTEAESGLSKITLEWMLNEAMSAGLHVTNARKDLLLGAADSNFRQPDPLAVMHRSLSGFWWLNELWPTKYWTGTSDPPGYKWALPLGRSRHIPPGSLVHDSVIARMRCSLSPSYRPANLPQDYNLVSTHRDANARF